MGYQRWARPPILRTRRTQRGVPPGFRFRENMCLVIQPNVVTEDARMGAQFGEMFPGDEDGPGAAAQPCAGADGVRGRLRPGFPEPENAESPQPGCLGAADHSQDHWHATLRKRVVGTSRGDRRDVRRTLATGSRGGCARPPAWRCHSPP